MSTGAAELAKSIASRDLSCRQAVESAIARIDAVDAETRAVACRRFEAALAEADEADRALASGRSSGVLHGVPITVKECLAVTGLPATFGNETRRDDRATSDDPYVARLRAAGAIVVATTNVAQLLAFAETDNPVYGRTSNPWDHDRSSGDSSGGEGVLTGAGASPLGVGTDFGGSVRIPAAWCGAVGFKPSAGVTPDVGTGSFPLHGPIASQVGVLSPTIADTVLGMRMISNGAVGHEADLRAGQTVAMSVDDGVFAVAPACVGRCVRRPACSRPPVAGSSSGRCRARKHSDFSMPHSATALLLISPDCSKAYAAVYKHPRLAGRNGSVHPDPSRRGIRS